MLSVRRNGRRPERIQPAWLTKRFAYIATSAVAVAVATAIGNSNGAVAGLAAGITAGVSVAVGLFTLMKK